MFGTSLSSLYNIVDGSCSFTYPTFDVRKICMNILTAAHRSHQKSLALRGSDHKKERLLQQMAGSMQFWPSYAEGFRDKKAGVATLGTR